MRILVLLFLVCFGLFSFAQLPDGSTAPDFTLMDLNSEEFNLYELTSSGKSVIIDFSATWCTICWNYHQGGALDHVHETYGPNGNNSVQVFWMEADGNTNTDCVYGSMGCNFSTKGDWTAGIDYPLFSLEGDDLVVKSDYNISGFPTIIAIAPNNKNV